MAFRRGKSWKPSIRQKADATSDWPWLFTYWRSTSISVSWRSTPSIMAATSDDEQRPKREWMHTDPRSACH